MAGLQDVVRFVDRAVEGGLVQPGDRTWAVNTVSAQVGNGPNASALLADEDFMANVMGLLMPKPSEVASRFWAAHAESPEEATGYFYRLSCESNYVRTAAIARNKRWEAATCWGNLQISINLSKPEKDPRDIARLAKSGNSPSPDENGSPVRGDSRELPAGCASGDAPAAHAEPTCGVEYPACRLCMENEGYWGRSDAVRGDPYPPRGNLRIVPLRLAGQRWGLQYSPYAYYTEHCIAMNSAHVPMHVDRPCFDALFDFVDLLPHYFIGSNADLPVVGGSILNHDHFQGGRHRFPMDEAPSVDAFRVSGFPNVDASVLKWPTSVLTLRGEDRVELVGCAERILEVWRAYDDATVGIVSFSDGVPHNTITPILRKDGGTYVLNLALRCNVASEEHPLGVFHPHRELHHIKRENIGLIEVMGLAILPARLERELAAVGDALISGSDLHADPLTASHADWAEELASRHAELDGENVRRILRQEVGRVFARVLETTGVFKWDEPGRVALHRFLDCLQGEG